MAPDWAMRLFEVNVMLLPEALLVIALDCVIPVLAPPAVLFAVMVMLPVVVFAENPVPVRERFAAA